MTNLVSKLILGAATLVLGAGLALAQTAPAPATAPAPKAAAPAKAGDAAKKGRSPESLACSAEAEKKGLKGTERKKFRQKCVRDARKAKDPKAAAPVEKKN